MRWPKIPRRRRRRRNEHRDAFGVWTSLGQLVADGLIIAPRAEGPPTPTEVYDRDGRLVGKVH